MKVAAVVPSLNPDEKFPRVIEGLLTAGFDRILVVNDGSDETYQHYFDDVARHPACTVLRHEQNKGKGRALKTAFAHYLKNPEDYIGVVTLDADGQHSAEDCQRTAQMLVENPEALVLGVRDFSQSDVPKKSALGNKITRTIFRLAIGMPITDTQTGLRGISNSFMQTLLDVEGDRYEFETNMLLETRRAGVQIMEVPISTIYIENNATSHFRPFQDGLRIYWLIIKFTCASLLSAAVDIGLFTLFNFLLATFVPTFAAAQRLLVAVVAARVCSAVFNFFVNHRIVFASKAGIGASMLRYAILAVTQMLASYGGVYLLSEVLPLHATPAKIITDLVLFCLTFYIQRRWVFRTK